MELEKAFEEFHSELFLYVFRMCNSKELAEDIVQEAFVRAALNRELLASLHEKQVRSWLYRVVKNLYIDTVRAGTRVEGAFEIPETAGITEDYETAEWTQLFDMLPGQQGVIMYMRYVEGYTCEDIAKILEMPSGTVRYEISMARKALKQAMKNYWAR